MSENLNEKLAKLKKLTKQIRQELFFHENAENWLKRKVIKQYQRLLKKKANLIRKLKKQRKLHTFKIRIHKDQGRYKLRVKIK